MRAERLLDPGDLVVVTTRHTMTDGIVVNEHGHFTKWIFARENGLISNVRAGDMGLVVASIIHSKTDDFRLLFVITSTRVGWSDTTALDREEIDVTG